MARFVLICIGGAIGTGGRFLLSTWVTDAFGGTFPSGTVLINVTGSFLIALILEVSALTGTVSQNARLFLTTGIMGGYTTYSSFNYETLRLLQDGSVGLGLLNLSLTVLGCLAAGLLGVAAARLLLHVPTSPAGR